MHWEITSLGLVTSTAVQNANMYLKVLSTAVDVWMQVSRLLLAITASMNIRRMDARAKKERRLPSAMFISLEFGSLCCVYV